MLFASYPLLRILSVMVQPVQLVSLKALHHKVVSFPTVFRSFSLHFILFPIRFHCILFCFPFVFIAFYFVSHSFSLHFILFPVRFHSIRWFIRSFHSFFRRKEFVDEKIRGYENSWENWDGENLVRRKFGKESFGKKIGREGVKRKWKSEERHEKERRGNGWCFGKSN